MLVIMISDCMNFLLEKSFSVCKMRFNLAIGLGILQRELWLSSALIVNRSCEP